MVSVELSDDVRAAYAGRSVLVTGGAGFIGSNVVRALCACGANVRVLDDTSAGDWDVLADLPVEKLESSVLNAAGLQQAVDGVQTVFHLAAVCSVPGSVRDPGKYHLVNTTGTMLLLEASRQAGVQRLVFSASSAAYGDLPGSPKVESMPIDPMSPYAASKVASEAALRAYAASYDGFDAVALRYFNVYGPGQNANSAYAAVIAAFANALAEGRAPTIYGDGGQSRDFVFIGDVAKANLLAGAATGSLNGQVINIGTGQGTTVLGLAEQMAAAWSAMGAEPAAQKPSFEPARAGEVLHSLANIDKAKNLLGFTPSKNLADGLADTLAWYRQQAQG